MVNTAQVKLPPPPIFDTILDNIGNTPLVRVNKIGKENGLNCEILAKCEFFNAGGSVKDRIGRRMIEDAESRGLLTPGKSIIIEPTSGNTGIGLALGCAVKGYRCIIVMPEKMSNEKVCVLKALGAEIVRTPTSAAWDSPESHIGVAKRLCHEIPNAIILDQYKNPANPLAHYEGTAQEILDQCQGKLDMIVIGAGTGGTIAGVAKRIKEVLPNCKVIGVDPVGSILAQPESLNVTDSNASGFYEVEGIGYDFIPDVLERKQIDKWYKSEDKPSLQMSRKLIREEGILCGGSCGAAMYCALKAAKDFGLTEPHHRIVVILPDSVRNYLSKFLDDNWMVERGFMEDPNKLKSGAEYWWYNLPVSSLKINRPLSIGSSQHCSQAIDIMKQQGIDQLPIYDEKNKNIIGVVTIGSIMSALLAQKITPENAVEKIAYKQFKKISIDATLYELSRMLEKDHFACIYDVRAPSPLFNAVNGFTDPPKNNGSIENGMNNGMSDENKKSQKSDGDQTEKQPIIGIVTSIDLLTFITSQAPK